MGLYIRKSFRAGPLRLNLSKRGLGVSAGVKGLRVGSGPRGNYVHAGRKGLYYRKSLGGKKSSPQDNSWILWLIGSIIALILVVNIIQWFIDNPAVFFPLVSIIVLFTGIIAYQKYRINKALNKLKYLFDNVFILKTLPINDEKLNEIEILKSKLVKNETLKLKICEIEQNVYNALLDIILDDNIITSEEKNYIEKLDRIISVEDNFKSEIKKEIFMSFYLDAIADRKITDDEIAVLNNIVTGLEIDQNEIKKEMLIVKEIMRMQDLCLPLTPIESVPMKIQKSEIPYYFASGKVLSRKKAKGGSDTDYEYSVRRDGNLVVTNKRVLVADEGTTAIKIDDILDIDVDLDTDMIVISKESSSKPVFLQTQEPLYCGKIINLLSNG